MTKLWNAWRSFLFASEDPEVIKAARFFIYGLASVFVFLKLGQPAFPDRPWQPISFFKVLSEPLPSGLIEVFRYLWLLASLCAAGGVWFSCTSVLSFIFALVFLGYGNNFGDVYHSTHLYVMCLGLMMMTARNSSLGIRLTKMYIVYVFVFCGLQKIIYNGNLSWAFSESFYLTVLTVPMQTTFGKWLLQQDFMVSRVLATYSLFVVELCAPLAFLNKKTGMAFFLIWSLFHIGVSLTLGGHIMFMSQIFCYTVFLPWKDILSGKGSRAYINS